MKSHSYHAAQKSDRRDLGEERAIFCRSEYQREWYNSTFRSELTIGCTRVMLLQNALQLWLKFLHAHNLLPLANWLWLWILDQLLRVPALDVIWIHYSQWTHLHLGLFLKSSHSKMQIHSLIISVQIFCLIGGHSSFRICLSFHRHSRQVFGKQS